MSQNCSSTIKQTLSNGAVVCCCKEFSFHTLYYVPFTLKDLCVNHYLKRYMIENKTELTLLPNWRLICENSKYSEELDFVMLLCKENVGS